jgi:hypothetical protein
MTTPRLTQVVDSVGLESLCKCGKSGGPLRASDFHTFPHSLSEFSCSEYARERESLGRRPLPGSHIALPICP